jgi:hypothetical protein
LLYKFVPKCERCQENSTKASIFCYCIRSNPVIPIKLDGGDSGDGDGDGGGGVAILVMVVVFVVVIVVWWFWW